MAAEINVIFTFVIESGRMTAEKTADQLLDERKALIDEAMRIRAAAREAIGEELLDKLYTILMGQAPKESGSSNPHSTN